MFSTIIAIIKAIPILQKWFEELFVLYFNMQVDSMRAENVKAIRKAIDEKDQREIEKALQSTLAGKRSSEVNSVIIDDINKLLQDR